MPWRHWGEEEVQLNSLLTSASDSEWPTSLPGRFTQLNRRMDGPQDLSGCSEEEKKFLALVGNRKPDSQVCSYMDTGKSLAIIIPKTRYSGYNSRLVFRKSCVQLSTQITDINRAYRCIPQHHPSNTRTLSQRTQPSPLVFPTTHFFYVLLTVHLSIILVINQLDAQNLVL